MDNPHRRTSWGTILFVGVTFIMSWGFVRLLAVVNRGTYPELTMTPWGMLVPGFAAIVLQVFVWHDSSSSFRSLDGALRWIFTGYLALTVIYGAVTVLAVALPVAQVALQGVGAVLLTTWTMLILFLGGQSDPEARRRVGLGLGNVRLGQRFVLGVALFVLAQAALNLLCGLGDLQGAQATIYGLPIPAAWYVPAAIVLFVAVSLVGVPLSGLAAVFGEEYGWRGFLQGRLDSLGRIPSALIVGLVWGVWHVPIILRGAHTYPPTWLGLLLGIVFFALWGVVQSYAVYKTGGIWVPAFMHGVVNSVYAFTLNYIVRPHDRVVSFGLGVYGLACLAVLVGFILRDPVWRRAREL